MKKIVLSFVPLLFIVAAKAQTGGPPTDPDLDKLDSVNKISSSKFVSVEQQPEFPGGMNNFYVYIAKNIRYPKEARKNKIEGKVNVSFVVDRDGRLTQVKVIKGVSEDIDAEAIRLISSSPAWKPGIQNSQPVRVLYNIIIAFKLPN